MTSFYLNDHLVDLTAIEGHLRRSPLPSAITHEAGLILGGLDRYIEALMGGRTNLDPMDPIRRLRRLAHDKAYVWEYLEEIEELVGNIR